MVIGLSSLIPSKDVKAYIKEKGVEFSLQEEATLVYLSRLDYDVKINFLKKIAENCADDNKLKKEIDARITYMNSLKNKFLAQEEKVIYTVAMHYNSDSDYNWETESLVFSKLEDAKNYLKQEIQDDAFLEEAPTKLKIIKKYVDTNPEEYIYAIFDTDFNLKDINTVCVKSFGEEDDSKDFTYSFVEIPHPFRRGDLVKDINTNKVYIVTYPKDDVDYKEDIERNKQLTLDAFDIGLYVEKLDKNRFNEYYIIPTQLEFIDLHEIENMDEAEKDYLNSISRLLKGEESLEAFSLAQKDYLRIF